MEGPRHPFSQPVFQDAAGRFSVVFMCGPDVVKSAFAYAPGSSPVAGPKPLKPSNRPFCFGISRSGRHLGATTMLDTDATVTTGLRPSTFGRLPTGFGDPDPTDLDRLAASLDYLALRCCKPAPDEPSQHPAAEAVAEDQQLLIGAVPAAGEQL